MIHAAPRRLDEALPHWLAGADRQLRIPYCSRCRQWLWPPRKACPDCTGPVEWLQASGRGTVLTYTVVHRTPNPELKTAVPYVLAIVQLDEGLRLLTNLVGCPPQVARIGLRVAAAFEATQDPELWVPVFTPVEEG